MKTIHAFFLVLICMIFSNCTQTENGSKSFTFQGKIIGQDTGKIILQYGILSTYHKDIANLRNGNFTIKGMIEEPTRAWMDGGDELNRTEIYLEPRVMNATLVKDKFKDINLTGSRSQEELNKLNKLLESSKNHDSILLNFVSKNPKSYLTPYYLQLLEANQGITLDSLESIYKGLDLSVQNSRYGRVTKGVIRKKENTSEGATVSEFKAKDINDQIITLSQFKGKNVVLMDFWNSPCIPCRKGMPHLKTLYNQYHSKGLEVIAVDCFDKNKDAWISALNQDSTTMFHHVATFFYTGEIINEDIIFDYPVMGGVPQTILISKDGKVIGHWGGYSKENDDSLDKKLAETFNY